MLRSSVALRVASIMLRIYSRNTSTCSHMLREVDLWSAPCNIVAATRCTVVLMRIKHDLCSFQLNNAARKVATEKMLLVILHPKAIEGECEGLSFKQGKHAPEEQSEINFRIRRRRKQGIHRASSKHEPSKVSIRSAGADIVPGAETVRKSLNLIKF